MPQGRCAHREADRARDRILRLLLDYEAAERRHELLKKQLETLEQQQKVARAADRTLEKIVNAEIEKDEAVRERMATHTRIK